MINKSKPTSTISNSAKVNIGETWATITTTWATETRTWADCQSIINNKTKKIFNWDLWTNEWDDCVMRWDSLYKDRISNLNKPQ